MANDRVVSKKTFGNHGQVIPGREPSLKTNGGLMYYSYDGMRNVTELTDRHGDRIEQYRYDAFGGLYTGVTAPYNTNSFAGKSYDAKANLIDMNARWYGAQNGRFTTADPYTGDILTPYTQNRYAYVGNNPINRWDPLGYWEDGDEDLTPKAQSAIRRLTDRYDATPIEDQVKRDSIHAQAESIRERDWERWESETETYKGSQEIEIENSTGETYKVTGGWNTDWTKTIEHIREYEVITSYYSEYAGKYAEEKYTRYDSTTKQSEGFNFRPFTAQEWYGENKSLLEEYETPPPYIPVEAYSSITSEYSFSSSTITSGTLLLINNEKVTNEYAYDTASMMYYDKDDVVMDGDKIIAFKTDILLAYNGVLTPEMVGINPNLPRYKATPSPIGVTMQEITDKATSTASLILNKLLLDNPYIYNNSTIEAQLSKLEAQLNQINITDFVDITSSIKGLIDNLATKAVSYSLAEYLGENISNNLDGSFYSLGDEFKDVIMKEIRITVNQISSLNDYQYLIFDKYARNSFVDMISSVMESIGKSDLNEYKESVNNDILKDKILTHLDKTRYININFNKSRKAYGQLLNAARKEMEDQIRFEILSDIIA